MRAVIAALALAACAPPAAPVPELPDDLRDTGLYADDAMTVLAAGVRPFTPQYPLWTDGATKRRWIYLPPGAAIDAAAVDAWQFPVGTRLWKEFAFGRRVETRYMERTADGWRYATYVWADDERDAVRAPAAGVRATAEVASGVRHAIPSELDCRICHEAGPTPVLGFSALQLSSDRDPGALHREPVAADAIELDELVATGALRGYPAASRAIAPRIDARSATERAALGYLHGNCGGCHRPTTALASVGVVLAYSLDAPAPRDAVLASLVDQPSRIGGPRVAPGDPAGSVVLWRISARDPVAQMPPLGTQVVDDDATRLIASWIASLAQPDTEGDTP